MALLSGVGHHTLCHEKVVLGDPKDCQSLPDEIKKTAFTRV